MCSFYCTGNSQARETFDSHDVPKSTLWHSSVLSTVTAQDSALPRPLLMLLLLPLTSVALLARLAAVVLVKT